MNPFADLAKNSGALLRDTARAIGTNIEHITATITNHGHQPLGNFTRTLPVLIIPRVTPCVVNRVNGLPQARSWEKRNFLVAQGIVITKTIPNPAINKALRLQLVYGIYESF